MVFNVVWKFRTLEKDISVPVGEVTLGRVFNVLGDTIDLEDKLDGSVRRDQFIDNHLTLTNYLLK